MFGLILVAIVAFVLVYRRLANGLRGLPPGPPPLPLLGNLLQFQQDMDKKFLEWKQEYGGVFTVWIPHPVVIFQESIVREGDNFGDRRLNDLLNEQTFGGNYGLVFQDNSIWKEQRRFALHSLRDLGYGTSRMEGVIMTYAHAVMRKWTAETGKAIDVKDDVMSIVANVTWNLVFGKTLPIDDPLIRHVRKLADAFNANFSVALTSAMEKVPIIADIDRLVGGPFSRFKEAVRGMRAIVEGEIREVESNLEGAPACFVTSFLREQKRLGSEIGSFSRIQLVAAAQTIWAAGFDTTVSTLRFGIHFIMSHPAVQSRMRDEIDRVVGERDITMDDQKSLHFCSATLQEIQRLVNVLPINFFRQTASDTVVGGYHIPAGMTILPQFQIVHTDPVNFERPDFFCPDRHLDDSGHFVKDARINPFSLGKRACIGEGLARMELFLILCTFVQHLRFSSPSVVPPPMEVLSGFARSIGDYEVVVNLKD